MDGSAKKECQPGRNRASDSRFIRQTKQFGRGGTAEIVATVENTLRVRRLDGVEVNFVPASAAASFDVGEARELKVAAGDWLLLQANHGKEFVNGERVQVREIQAGRMALADGRVPRQLIPCFEALRGVATTTTGNLKKEGARTQRTLLEAPRSAYAKKHAKPRPMGACSVGSLHLKIRGFLVRP